jgi:hypothetical protein
MAYQYKRLGALIGAWIIALGSTVSGFGADLVSPPRPTIPAATDRNDGSITLTGCLLLGPYGDYTLSKTIVAAGSVTNSIAWKLEDHRQLLAHVLEKVEVTGTMLPMPDAPRAVGSTGSDRPADATEYRLRIKSIKKVGDCS